MIFGRARSKSRGILKTPSPARRRAFSGKKVTFQIVDFYAPPPKIVNQKIAATNVKKVEEIKRPTTPSTKKPPVPEKKNLKLPQGAMF